VHHEALLQEEPGQSHLALVQVHQLVLGPLDGRVQLAALLDQLTIDQGRGEGPEPLQFLELPAMGTLDQLGSIELRLGVLFGEPPAQIWGMWQSVGREDFHALWIITTVAMKLVLKD